ncbi:MAG: PH domain-containing protein [Mobilicoccus sp.]|nr:PH domain-containing protein [Mobilicoccus sp.]
MNAAPSRRDPYAVIRPRRGRIVPVVVGVGVLAVFTAMAVFVPGQAMQKDDWALSDRLMLFFIGVATAMFLSRFAFIKAVPTREGITVRNLFITRRLAWADVVRLQFGGGSPWAYLDTWDTETVPLMAIQKADGAFGRAEAGRLAALIDYHSGREPERGSSEPSSEPPDEDPPAS